MRSCDEKIKCNLCGATITKINFTKHLRRHKNHPETFRVAERLIDTCTHICRYCGKVCKSKRSNFFHERVCKLNPDRKLIEGFNTIGRKAWNKGLTVKTSQGMRNLRASLMKHYETHDGPATGTHLSDEIKKKISEGRKRYLQAHPEKVPYKLNHSSNISYPEKYFKELFAKENIDFKYHLSVGTYQLDFYNKDKMVDLEIDGEQHYVDPKMPKHDKIRTEFLTKLGWKVVRIRWSEFKAKSKEEKHEVIEKLRDLLK